MKTGSKENSSFCKTHIHRENSWQLAFLPQPFSFNSSKATMRAWPGQFSVTLSIFETAIPAYFSCVSNISPSIRSRAAFHTVIVDKVNNKLHNNH